jgi:diguanylate cyclase (GGDEF)-like protein
MIRFVIRDVIKESSAISRLINNLHKSLTHINDDIKITIADSIKRFEERDLHNNEMDQQILVMETVVSESQELADLKLQTKQHLDTMQASLKASVAAEQEEQNATIDIMQKMQQQVEALEAEAVSYKHKLVTQRVANLSDQLTKLPNRMAYEEKALFEVQNSKKTGTSLCIGILDIDHFKRINDTYGHSVGDKTLQIIAKHIRQHLPKDDFVARWGGEEFVILLPNTTIQEAFSKVELVRTKISTLPFKFKGERVTVTLSCGLSEINQEITLEEAFEKADSFLYIAKNLGRNQTVFTDI